MKLLKQLWCYLTTGHQYRLVRIVETDVYKKHCSECGCISQNLYEEDGTPIILKRTLLMGPR